MKRFFLLASVAVAFCACGPEYVRPSMTEGSSVDFSLRISETVFSLEKDGNVCISPYSAGVALSMLAEGAENATREEFLTVLNGCIFGKKDFGSNDTVVVKSANSLWTDDDFAIRNKYVNLLEKDFGAFATSLSFAEPSTVRAINNWCAENTEGKITDMVKELNPANPLVVANALYFRAPWDVPFSEGMTRKGVFHGVDGDSETDFMNRVGVYEMAEYQGNVMVRLPYQGGRYAMTLIMPSEKSDFSGLLRYFNAQALEKAFSSLTEQRVRLSVPKFRFEYEINMNETLKQLGLQSAFTSAADFKAIALGPLTLSSVLHKTFIEVDEQGSEAAAVTMGMMALTAAPPRNVQTVTFDRPFYFIISDIQDSTVLFTGRIVDL